MFYLNNFKTLLMVAIAFSFLSATVALAEDVIQVTSSEVKTIDLTQESSGAAGSGIVDGIKNFFKGDPAAKGDDELNKNLDIDFAKLHQEVETKFAEARALAMTSNNYEKLKTVGTRFSAERASCTKWHASAASSCLENLSEHMISGTSKVNALLSTLNVFGVNDSCNKMGQAMNIAQVALTGYTGVCGAMKSGCGLFCVGARKTLGELQKLNKEMVNKCPPPTSTLAADCEQKKGEFETALKQLSEGYQQELAEDQIMSMAGKAKLCTDKYANLLLSGLTGLASVGKSLSDAKKCEEDSVGNDMAANSKNKCDDPANAQLPECICLKKPNTPGCENGPTIRESNSSNGSIAATGGVGDIGLGSNDGMGPDFGSGGIGEDMPGVDPREPASAGMAGGGGSSAGLSGGGGDSGSGAGGSAGDGKSKLNTNILGGGAGGGGGGWGSGSFGSGGDKYRAYLPGGDKDPNRGVAGQDAAWNKEVTGHGGKSNWDKIKDRYRDNRNSLLAN